MVIAIAPTRQMRDFMDYWIALALVVAVLALIVLLLRSRYGLALKAIRDNELAASCNGIDVHADQDSGLYRHSLRHGDDRRIDLSAEAAHLARCRLLASTTGPRS